MTGRKVIRLPQRTADASLELGDLVDAAVRAQQDSLASISAATRSAEALARMNRAAIADQRRRRLLSWVAIGMGLAALLALLLGVVLGLRA